ncbi:hypothetical protein HDV04_002296 [Boothiomyces sp. JEL0838]|nr:hypothetical protein HDV04_002296 [Boothiomyces sp. JEL0838]
MKRGLWGRSATLYNFEPLSEEQIVSYAAQFLQEHQVQDVSNVVSRISSFKLCHGRPRFVAFILDEYMQFKDIEYAINKFAMSLSDVEDDYFPLKFFKRDLDNNKNPLLRVVGDSTLGKIICDALVNAIWLGSVTLSLPNDQSTLPILYGLGYGLVLNNILRTVEISELAVIECLRYFVPFASMIKGFAEKIRTSMEPQTVGYLMEYLVAFALVSQYADVDTSARIKASRKPIFEYLVENASNEVCFPDHMCGPDVVYKCSNTSTVYIVQVKFVESLSKQESVNAFHTTDPDNFYCNRKTGTVLKGYERSKDLLSKALVYLQKNNYKLQRMLIIHSEIAHRYTCPNVVVVTNFTDQNFFSSIGADVWKFLDMVRNNFRSAKLNQSSRLSVD